MFYLRWGLKSVVVYYAGECSGLAHLQGPMVHIGACIASLLSMWEPCKEPKPQLLPALNLLLICEYICGAKAAVDFMLLRRTAQRPAAGEPLSVGRMSVQVL